MPDRAYRLYDCVAMKKPHPCGFNEWEIIFIGSDIKLKCLHCGHIVLMPRQNFEKALRKIINKEQIKND